MGSTEKNPHEEYREKKKWRNRPFPHASPVLWSQLPQQLEKTENLGAFKKGIKTHLCKLVFPDKYVDFIKTAHIQELG